MMVELIVLYYIDEVNDKVGNLVEKKGDDNDINCVSYNDFC